MQQLLRTAAELGLIVIERRGRHLGGYHHDSRTIRLDPNLPRRVARSVLAHELGHAVFGDVPSMHGPVNAKQERRAFEWAALQLIERDAYAASEERRGGHPGSMAFDLDVTPDIVTAYQRLLLRLGDTVYVGPRHGAGQWHDRVDLLVEDVA